MRDLSSTAFPGGKETDTNSELQRLRADVSRYRKLFYVLIAVLVVLLVAGIIVSAIMANEARRRSDELRRQLKMAAEEAKVTTALKDLLQQDLLELADPAPE